WTRSMLLSSEWQCRKRTASSSTRPARIRASISAASRTWRISSPVNVLEEGDMSEAEIFERLSNILVEEFELDRAAITREAHLYEDLELDSIDAVDLVIRLQQMTGARIKPEDF